ncbi:MAG TPA: nickel pincer cofactor biosynthesis protein LarB [Iamia sp.]|nr:nickel pincer cofactor biosynthesis protein LarB [Iamia sp.]
MDETALRALVAAVAAGEVGPDEAVARLRRLPFADLGFARVDHHRLLRTGLPEAVYAPGKTAEQCAALVGELLAGTGGRPEGGRPDERGGPVLLTRADAEQASAALAAHPDGVVTGDRHRLVAWRPAPPRPAHVVVVSAGTADLPVADECAATLAALGLPAVRLTDVGVAGVHRLLADVDLLAGADAIVVVAGMEGALASVVGGLTAAPVVAVPTSVGYGASLEGVTALLAMLSSCAAGITVVGIDNGYGAACAVSRLLVPAGVTARA